MTSYNETRIQIPGFSIALKLWHNKNTKPILCLHGKLDNAASFDLLAPLLPDFQLAAVDYPGTGYSSPYQEGVLPYWKNDAFLMLHLVKALKWEKFDIIAHSLGALLATIIAIAIPKQVGKIVFLDILGPTVKFTENGPIHMQNDVTTYLNYKQYPRIKFPDLESAIQNRMKVGNISYQAAQALVHRGVQETEGKWAWTFDPRLYCVNSLMPYEDEIRASFRAIQSPVCVIRAKQGVPYSENIFQGRAQSIKELVIHELQGGHHVHMDDPIPVANVINQFLGN